MVEGSPFRTVKTRVDAGYPGSRFAGRVCIVTGSGGGLGRATALRLAAEGASVVGCDIDAEAAADTMRRVIEAGGTMISVHPADLRIKADCARVVAEAVEAYGAVDVLFNNGAAARFAWIAEMSDEAWSDTI